MSDWITDRRPTIHDTDVDGYVWITTDEGDVQRWHWQRIDNCPWMHIPKIVPPDPYVKPKRWLAVWSNVRRMWTLRNTLYSDPEVHAYNIGLVCLDYLSKQDQHREAAERIAAIYEEVMP